MPETENQQQPSNFGFLIAAMNGLGSALIIVITLMICADIIGRGFFGTPVAGVAEMVSLTIVAIVFLQLGQAVRTNTLARTNIVLNAVQRRSPRLAELINGLYDLAAATLFLVLLYGSWGKLVDTWTSNEHVGTYGLFVAPVWPVSVVVVIGSATAALQFLVLAYRNFSPKNNQKAQSKDGDMT